MNLNFLESWTMNSKIMVTSRFLGHFRQWFHFEFDLNPETWWNRIQNDSKGRGDQNFGNGVDGHVFLSAFSISSVFWVHDNLVLSMIKMQVHLESHHTVYNFNFIPHRYQKTGTDEWLDKKLFSKPVFLRWLNIKSG